MARSEMRLRVKWAWWVTYLYLPLTRFGIWLGVPVDPKVISDDIAKGVRFDVVK
ncbi:MAG: hypothetical protein KG075_17585 [Alphaproteobacteria bacterium]|nr:hypothetical protein [Alphaproteobacteria bacterium]